MNRNYAFRLVGTVVSIAMAFLAGFLGAETIFGDGNLTWWDIPVAVIAVGCWVWNTYAIYPGLPVKTPVKD